MYWQFKLGMSFMKLAFNMESWEACGGGAELSGEEALAVGNKYIDKALEIFEEVSLVNLYRIWLCVHITWIADMQFVTVLSWLLFTFKL